jgi:hypothetical protein
MILADRSDADGWSFYAQDTIASKAEVTRKTVRTALQGLEEKGFIRRLKRSYGNLRTSDHIQISLGKNFHQEGKNLPTIPYSPYGVVEDKKEGARQDGAKVIPFARKQA